MWSHIPYLQQLPLVLAYVFPRSEAGFDTFSSGSFSLIRVRRLARRRILSRIHPQLNGQSIISSLFRLWLCPSLSRGAHNSRIFSSYNTNIDSIGQQLRELDENCVFHIYVSVENCFFQGQAKKDARISVLDSC